MDEAQIHEHNQFLTLTYSDDHLPPDQSLDLEHTQKFMKRLRKSRSPDKLRFMMAGEYGEERGRPHYHAIVFNLELPDLELYRTNGRQEPLYRSRELNRIWGKGDCIVGAVTQQSCSYVAGYMLSSHREGRSKGDPKYSIQDEQTGELIEKKRPFITRSNRPGIGMPWLERWGTTDLVGRQLMVRKVNGRYREVPIPEGYLRWLRIHHREAYDRLRESREEKINSEQFQWNNTPERRAVRETVMRARINQSPRGGTDRNERT